MAAASIYDYSNNNLVAKAYAAVSQCKSEFDRYIHISQSRALVDGEWDCIEALQRSAFEAINAAREHVYLRIANTNDEFMLKVLVKVMGSLEERAQPIRNFPLKGVLLAYNQMRACESVCNRLLINKGTTLSPSELDQVQTLRQRVVNAYEETAGVIVTRICSTKNKSEIKALKVELAHLASRFNALRNKVACFKKAITTLQGYSIQAIISDLKRLWQAEWRPLSQGGLKNNPKFLTGLKVILDRIFPLDMHFSADSIKSLQESHLFEPLLRMYLNCMEETYTNNELLNEVLRVGPNRPMASMARSAFNSEMSTTETTVSFFNEMRKKGFQLHANGDSIFIYDEASFNQWRSHYEPVLRSEGWWPLTAKEFIDRTCSHPPKDETPLFDAVAAAFGDFGGPGCKDIDFSRVFAVPK